MTKYREIIRLTSLGCSQRIITASCNVSQKTVVKVQKRAKELNLSWPLEDSLTEIELSKLMFPQERISSQKRMPDFEYIRKELFRVRNTEVNVNFCDTLPDGELYRTEEKTVQISSERLDAVIARVYNLSREDAQRLFLRGLVFASGRQIDSTCYTPKENEKISVRGLGRFIYRGYVSSSKKGKLNVLCELYV